MIYKLYWVLPPVGVSIDMKKEIVQGKAQQLLFSTTNTQK